MSDEQWRPVPGYEGIYEVSSLGRIRRGARVHRLRFDKKGYCRAALCVNSQTKYLSMHRIVALAFLPTPAPNRTQVNHINGVKSDNRVANLEWVTGSENQEHAFRTGLNTPLRGVRNPKTKLTEVQVQAIRSLVKGTVTASAVARTFKVTRVNILAIWRGEIWQSLPWPQGVTPLVGDARRVHSHGTEQCHRQGCRCEPCKEARRAYMRERYWLKQADLHSGLIVDQLSRKRVAA